MASAIAVGLEDGTDLADSPPDELLHVALWSTTNGRFVVARWAEWAWRLCGVMTNWPEAAAMAVRLEGELEACS